MISGIFFSPQAPKPRYRGDVLESQIFQRGTEPGRYSDQTYPHSERGKSSLDLLKTSIPKNTTQKFKYIKSSKNTFQNVHSLPGKWYDEEIFQQDCWGKNCFYASTLDFSFPSSLKGKSIIKLRTIFKKYICKWQFSWSPEDESHWLGWSPGFPLATTWVLDLCFYYYYYFIIILFHFFEFDIDICVPHTINWNNFNPTTFHLVLSDD